MAMKILPTLTIAALLPAGAAIAEDPTFRIVHRSGVAADVQVSTYYPGGTSAFLVRRNESTMPVEPAQIKSMKRLSPHYNRFELEFADGTKETVIIPSVARIEGEATVASVSAQYASAVADIESMEQKE